MKQHMILALAYTGFAFSGPWPVITAELAGLGDDCDITPMGLFPECEKGLVCQKTRGIWIGGSSQYTCEEIRVGLGETCGGLNESTGKPYPDCEKGLVCLRTGKFSIPGRGNTC